MIDPAALAALKLPLHEYEFAYVNRFVDGRRGLNVAPRDWLIPSERVAIYGDEITAELACHELRTLLVAAWKMTDEPH